MSKFKVGDRVTMNVSASRYTNHSGVVVRVVKNENSVDNLVVQFDCNEPGHVVSYSDSYFKYAPVEQKDPTLREIILKAKSESAAPGEKFSKAKHKEDVVKKHKELTEKGIKPESLLTKENLSQWLGEGMSYMRIARELVGVPENEIAAVAKTFGLQSDVKKYIVMKKGSK